MIEKTSESDFTYKIENVVSTIELDIDDPIDLNNLAREFVSAEYNPERFPGLILRLGKPRATLLIFSTGKVVCTGMRRAKDLPSVIVLLKENLKQCKIKINSVESKVQNIVASGNINALIDLNMAAVVMEHSMYEPEVFPGLIYRMQDPKTVFLVFSTGKVVCTGAKSKEQVGEAVEKLYYKVRECGVTMDKPIIDMDDEELAFL